MAELSLKNVSRMVERHSRWLFDPLTGERADFTGQTVSRLSNFDGADLRCAIFRGANLHGVDLEAARLNGADFRGALLMDSSLRGADLTDADLTGAYLHNARMSQVKLTGTKLSVRSHPSDADTSPITVEPYTDLAKDILSCIDSALGLLAMRAWHTPETDSCGTAHCLAGWAVNVYDADGRLEGLLRTSAAAALIFQACLGEVPDYYSTNDVAFSWLKKKAAVC